LDDWEDDFYLDRIEALGIKEFNPINEDYQEDENETDGVVVTGTGRVGTPLGAHQGYVDGGDLTDIDKHTFKVS
jgi:hypothetical protein